MCGMAGFWRASGRGANDEQILQAMTQVIAHRGPDDAGHWLGDADGPALGHRRLAIIDLSPAGHQPMVSASGRFVTVYNGEIYNHRALRRELEDAGAAPAWRGHSDTETLLAAVELWGIDGALARVNGMFALALWDRRERRLTLARDRLGEKPLFYGTSGGHFLFGSELKAFQGHPSFAPEVDRNALALFMRYNYVPAPFCIWRGIKKLPPGCLIEVDGPDRVGEPRQYWSLAEAADRPAGSIADRPEPHADELERLLRDAVAIRMEADVPLGAFLSGGVDSSLIVALMQVQSAQPVKTFTIGFADKQYDEADHARAVARHLGTDHTELTVEPGDALSLVPRLAEIWDEPFGDSSQIPTFLVSQLARRSVTVSLSGDGGDELFGGYNRYLSAPRLRELGATMPAPLRRAAAAVVRSRAGMAAALSAAALLPPSRRPLGLRDRLAKVGLALESSTDEALYRGLVSQSATPEALVLGAQEPEPPYFGSQPQFGDFRSFMMYADSTTYLPDDILAKVDRASMAVSLEARVPFLDHRVVEYAWSLPMEAKIAGGEGKRILREILYRHVPRTLIERPKMGFGLPLGGWLTGPLRDWAENLFDPARLAAAGYLDPVAVRALWDRQLARGDRTQAVWGVLMFEAWRETYTGAAPAAAGAAVAA